MKPEDAISKIDDISSIVAVEIPETLELNGIKYNLRADLYSNNPGTLTKYTRLYEELRAEIMKMDEVPEELVKKAIVLRRVVIFLKDYKKESDIDEKKRWLEYARRVKP
ncbi:MAG: hypothetical protein GXO25_07790 [Euryarchaeota archaeon]|uniref:Uncharacterized protein n=1 Tax=uncultured euryarchaeote Alv-FOS4 TaxID=337893 RepID=Q3SA61_9EURY|nr:hypothetical protein [uncultured euryarchaeote Alv-FOS4]NPA75961.1 hypothetical protein [Euryarchaeota archaeon]